MSVGHRSRHGELRGAIDSALVAAHGPAGAIADATALLITADAGGSNGAAAAPVEVGTATVRQSRTGLAITVCHFPPGTSKWNKIEHRLFSHIAMNWRGTPLVDLATIVSLIGATRQPRRACACASELDRGPLPGRRHVTDCANGARAARTASLPRRLELHHPAREG